MKNICVFLLSTLFCVHSYGDFKICINSRIYDGMAKANLASTNEELKGYQKLGIKVFGDSILGHASLEIKHKGKTIRSYGYWPNTHLNINSDHVTKDSTSDYKFNDKTVKTSVASKCYPINLAGIEKIEKKAKSFKREHGAWSDWNNCVKFAAQIFTEITGSNMNTTLPLPKSLYQAIQMKSETYSIYSNGDEYIIDNSSSQ